MTTETNDTPPGWKLVPVEPTEEMVEAAAAGALGDGAKPAAGWPYYILSCMKEACVAMLAASPEPPARNLPSREEIAAVIKKLERASKAMMDGRLPRYGQLLVSEEAMADAVAILSLLRGDTAKGGEG